MAQPVIAEWSAAERAQLETLIARGAIAVVYTGCELRLLPACNQPGHYLWHRTATSTDEYAFRDEDELSAKLPLAAASLRASLAQKGGLRLTTTVVGQLQLTDYSPSAIGLVAACNEATHLVQSVSVGASELSSMANREIAASATALQIGASGTTRSEEAILHRSGMSATCAVASQESLPRECAAPIQLFLEPIPRAARPQVTSAPLSVHFQSQESGVVWAVESDGRTLCQTPCSQVIDPTRGLRLSTAGGFMQQAQVVDVPDLLQNAGTERVTVRAYPRNTAKLAGGITMTTFGGIAFATGVTLLSIGYGMENADLGKAGLITFVASPALLIPGIWLIVDSMARAELLKY